ncbi:ABC transporter ATP-binding protein [Deinococcus metallilatus]|uniref:ABC transporter ATP-binding protein n=1 Tax=Deinococcus metallilatus TaxID=1211322 RepID=A0AAJ5F1C1_9DEIO|nr:ABC transporter ATP-binding protein [Deinococcus metallilatus]MBB5296233.1 branched-chain amino acid transport system ATP-binding protein [Deinococcus metallilatus]QBY09720.1 ABC transporter ATP-binding protein [Deinococcus metallilatus]RXJ08918.1 ABC transporter ATP-binding protein [Deinococcus metallilatus]TLK23703.1 ABC transporter ATP-binding protein [Deinococcus metallilatus]
MTAATALEARHLVKDFRGFRATNDVNLQIREGEIHAIIGPNGAGKTTLFNLLSGFLRPTSGEVALFGERIDTLPPHAIVRRGLSRSFQISSVFPSLTVRENLLVALESPTNLPKQFWTPLSRLEHLGPRADQILADVGLGDAPDRLAADLSHGEKRQLEIGISLTQEPRVLLLDEPTSGMGSEGINRVIALVRQVARGRTVVLVEHNMSVVSELADRITVLQYGQVLASGRYDEVRRDPRVIEAYLGEEAHA